MGKGSQGGGSARPHQAEGYFKGDDDLMVDRLVSACAQQKKAAAAPLPGFGRELVPYFVPGDDEPSHSNINGDLSVHPQPCMAAAAAKPKKANKSTRTVTILKNGTLAVSEAQYARTEDGERLKMPSQEFIARAAAGITDAQRRAAANAFAAAASVRSKPQKEASAAPPRQPPQPQPQRGNKTVVLAVPVAKASTTKTPAPAAAAVPKAVWASGAHTNSPAPLHIPMPSMLSSLPTPTAAAPTPAPAAAAAAAAQAAKPKPMLLTPAQLLAQAMASQQPAPPRPTATNDGGAALLAMLQPAAAAAPTPARRPHHPPHQLVDASASQALRELLNF